MDVLKKITQLRLERGWSEYKLAQEAGITQSTISNLYRRNNSPTIATLKAICDALGITLAQFFSERDPELTTEQAELLHKCTLLSKNQKKLALAYIQGILDK